MATKKFYHLFLIISLCLAVSFSAGCSKDNPTGDGDSTLAASRIAYISADGLYSVDMTGENAQQLVDGEKLSSPLFSSDGTALAYKDGQDLYAYDFAARKSSLLLTAANSYSAGAASSFYASSAEEGLLRIENQGAKKTVLLTPLGVGNGQTDSSTTDSSAVKQGPGPIKSTQISQILATDMSEGSYLEYRNLTTSPDFSHLAFNIYITDGSTAYSGGVWIMDTATEEFTLAVEGKKSTESEIGSDPEPGKFSPDGKTLFVWQRTASASLSADGVSYGLYDLASKKLTLSSSLPKSNPADALAYNENVSFSEEGSFALLAGGNRDMDMGKLLQIVTYNASSIEAEGIYTGELVPAMPNLSKDAKSLYFAAFTGQDPALSVVPEYEYPLQRQLYVYSGREITALTDDAAYRVEAPHLLKDNAHLLFGRINNQTDEMSLWLMATDGSEAKQLAAWPMPDESRWLYNDYYGRGDWDGMVAYYDATE